jgi:hypothetical protein
VGSRALGLTGVVELAERAPALLDAVPARTF